MPRNKITNTPVQSPVSQALENATGTIRYTFLNNYMFISILEKNPDILKSLVCSLLHLKNDDSVSITVMNPITYGDSPADKTYILDIKVMLNGKSMLNLEMQVTNNHDYNYRATHYLCRVYDNMCKGEDYISSSPAIHIGFLDYDLYDDEKEFYSRHLLTNIKTGRIFNDRFEVRIISMRQTDLATEEDKRYKIDKWVKLFKATTWEELIMIATTPEMQNAAQNLFKSNSDLTEIFYAQAYEDFVREQARTAKKLAKFEEMSAELKTQAAALADKDATINTQATALADKDAALANKDAALANKDATISTQADTIAKLRTLLAQNGITE